MLKYLNIAWKCLYRSTLSHKRGGIVETVVLVDEVRVDEKYLIDALSKRGVSAKIIDVRLGEVPEGDLALVRTSNPYVGIALAQFFERAINSALGIYRAVNKVLVYRLGGLKIAPICGDSHVEGAVRIIGLPAILDTAWRLGLEGPVTSVEGLKSVLEYRVYMRNPLAKLSLLVEYYEVVREEFLVEGSILSELGLDYALVKYGRVNGREVVVDVDPVPRLDRQRAEVLADRVVEVVRR